MQSFFGSLVQAARMAALFGTQYQKAAFRVVPPSWDVFSSTRTLLPCQQLNKAVARPATPLPIVITSTSASNLPLAAAGVEDLRAMVAMQVLPRFCFFEKIAAAFGFYRFLKMPRKNG